MFVSKLLRAPQYGQQQDPALILHLSSLHTHRSQGLIGLFIDKEWQCKIIQDSVFLTLILNVNYRYPNSSSVDAPSDDAEKSADSQR